MYYFTFFSLSTGTWMQVNTTCLQQITIIVMTKRQNKSQRVTPLPWLIGFPFPSIWCSIGDPYLHLMDFVRAWHPDTCTQYLSSYSLLDEGTYISGISLIQSFPRLFLCNHWLSTDQGCQGLSGVSGFGMAVRAFQGCQGCQGFSGVSGLFRGVMAFQGCQGLSGLSGLVRAVRDVRACQGCQGCQGLSGVSGGL